VTTWRVGLRVRKLGRGPVVTLTADLGGGVWAGIGPDGETVALAQTDEWDPVA